MARVHVDHVDRVSGMSYKQKTAELSNKYTLEKSESASLRGLSRRLNNIQKIDWSK